MKTVELRGNEKLEELINKMLVSRQEELLVAFGKTANAGNQMIFLIEEVDLADEAFLTRSFEGLRWDPKLTAQWVRKAELSKSGVVLMHAHPNKGSVGFSSIDLRTKNRILDHFNLYLPHTLSGYCVIGNDDFKGDFIYNGKLSPLSSIRSVSCPLVKRTPYGSSGHTSFETHHRQELALGEEANARLNITSVGLVGLGGAGSMIAQQLAHLKVGKIILIDGDRLEKSNLSRVVGATNKDIGKYKTVIAKRMIKRIDPSIDIRIINDYLPTPKIYKELKTVDIILSSVDKTASRVAINNFAKRYLVPAIDVGVTIRRPANHIEAISGQIIRLNPASRCMRCIGLVSPALEQQEEIQNYGAGVTNPQVITFNGVLSSIALGEFLKIIAGIAGNDRETANLVYNGLTGEVERVRNPNFICLVCKSQYAQGDPTYS